MRTYVLKDCPASVHSWRTLALALSALAIALSGYGRFVRQPSGAHAVSAAHRAALPGEPLVSGETAALADEPHAASREAAPAPREDSAMPHEDSAVPREASLVPAGADRATALRLLSEKLQHAPDSELSDVTNALLELGGPEAFARLSAATRSPRSALRDAAFSALSGLDTVENRDFMRAALNGPDAAAALKYFLDCHDAQAVPALERLARSPLPELSGPALDALLAQGARAESAFTRLLEADTELMDAMLVSPPHTRNPRRALRAAAVARLHDGAISSGPVFDFLEQDLSDESREALAFAAHDPASADAACGALSRKGDAASLASLSQLASDGDPRVAGAASCALASDPDSRSRVPLERVLPGNAQGVASRALAHINAPGARAI